MINKATTRGYIEFGIGSNLLHSALKVKGEYEGIVLLLLKQAVFLQDLISFRLLPAGLF